MTENCRQGRPLDHRQIYVIYKDKNHLVIIANYNYEYYIILKSLSLSNEYVIIYELSLIK